MEQCTEWQRQLYINFLEFEKALTACTGKVCGTSFGLMGYHSRLSTSRKALQQLHMQSRQQRNQLWSEDWCQTKLYNVGDALRHDHCLGNELHNRRSVMGIRWTLVSMLEDLDFGDDSALVSHAGKENPTKHLRTASWPEDQPKEDRSDAAERVQPLTSSCEWRRPANNWRVHHLNKARNAFRMLNNVWRSSQYITKTKVKIYQSCVMSTLLYGSECWRMTENGHEWVSENPNPVSALWFRW